MRLINSDSQLPTLTQEEDDPRNRKTNLIYDFHDLRKLDPTTCANSNRVGLGDVGVNILHSV